MESLDSSSQWVALRAPRSTPFPNVLQRLLLRAALGDADEAAAAAHEWSRTADLDRIDFGSFSVLPLLVRNLERLDLELPAADRLRGIYRRSWYRNQVLMRGARSALDSLEGVGIPALVIKGGALVNRYFPDSGTRPMSDVDLLVAPANRDVALSRLRASGWKVEQSTVGIETRHAVELTNASHGVVDLHWATCFDLHPAFDETPLFKRSSPGALLGPVSILAPEDELLLAVRHGIRQGRIAWIADVALIVRSGQVDWLRLQETSVLYGAVELMEASLRLVADLTRVPIPDSALRALASSSRPNWHRREARTLMAPPRALRLQQFTEAWYRYRRWSSNGGLRANPTRFPAHWAAVLGLRGTPGLLAHALRVSRLGSWLPRSSTKQ